MATRRTRQRPRFLDRPLEESLGLGELLASDEVSSDDVGLRFYLEVLGLRHLHYGLWEESDPLTLDGLRSAQDRYLERLLGLIPEGVSTVLDVGCGAGANALALKEQGLDVEGLSPEASHGLRFTAATGGLFHRTTFENFRLSRRFDLIFMSESAQYVPLDRLFPSIEEALVPGGYLLLSDYFVLEKDGSYLAKSGHLLADFERAAESSRLAVEEEQDITEEVAPTLDLACALLESYLLPSVKLALLRSAQKKRFLTRLVARFLRKRARKVEHRLENLDSESFKTKKRYLIYRFGLPESG